jgi:formyl-CoA transferase
VFKTTDGHINIATTGGAIWERFCRALGAEAMLKNPDYQSAKARSQNRKALNAEINTCTANKSSAEWIEIFNKAGVPCGPIYSIDQVFADPQVKHLRIAQSVKKKDKSTLTVVGQPVVLSRTGSRIAAPSPALGQHTSEVLKEFGFSAKEIAALRKAKAV